jgi:hypothetical protein
LERKEIWGRVYVREEARNNSETAYGGTRLYEKLSSIPVFHYQSPGGPEWLPYELKCA